MNQVLVLVEGQTEETFVRDVLAQHLLVSSELWLTPVLVTTKRTKSGLKFKGGISEYSKVRRELLHLLGNRGALVVTTMLDYYGLPRDFPGSATLPPRRSGHERVAHLEKALQEDIGDRRLLPYLSLHEFEALLFSSPGEIQSVFDQADVLAHLEAACAAVTSPEEINDGVETHPAARLVKLLPSYRKTAHGPIIAQRIGLPILRERCPHFDRWVTALESLGRRSSG